MENFDRLASILHTISCSLEHEDDVRALLNDRDPSKCYYYLEESLVDVDLRNDHNTWISHAAELCKTLAMEPNEVIRVLTLLLDLRRRLDEILLRNPSVEELARLVLFDVPR